MRIADAIDRLSRALGAVAAGCTLAMVLVGAFNAVARYLARDIGVDLSSNRWIELQWYLFSMVFLLGAPATLREDRHVRVDVLYRRCSPRGRAWIDVVGGLFLLLPFCAFAAWSAWGFASRSLAQMEQSSDPDGLARWPIKLLAAAAFTALLLAGIAFVLRRLPLLFGTAADAEGGAR